MKMPNILKTCDDDVERYAKVNAQLSHVKVQVYHRQRT